MQPEHQTKTCAACSCAKAPSEFPTDRKRKDGLHPYCRQCVRARSKAYYEKNLDAARAKRKAYDAAHKDEKNARTRKYRAENAEHYAALRSAARRKRAEEIRERERVLRASDPEKHREKSRKHRANNAEYYREKARRHAKASPEQYAARAAARRAAKLNATPAWEADFTKFVMLEARRLAKVRSQAFGFPWHVDHIVPLKSPVVCGLHTWSNLRVVTAAENQRKYNRFEVAV